jgi:hypothetical protein
MVVSGRTRVSWLLLSAGRSLSSHWRSPDLIGGSRRFALGQNVSEAKQSAHRVYFLGPRLVPVPPVDTAQLSCGHFRDDVRLAGATHAVCHPDQLLDVWGAKTRATCSDLQV